MTDDSVWITFGRPKASLRGIGRAQDDMGVHIAATVRATVHGLQLATRNTRHFAETGVARVNPGLPAARH